MTHHAPVKEELIGRHVVITTCTDPSWIGCKGVILDETKHTFLIETMGKQKRIAKKTAIFEIQINGKTEHIEGIRLLFQPENRIKKAR